MPLQGTPASRCFNPVLGFLSVATPLISQRTSNRACFNPVLGFLSVATRLQFNGRTEPSKFQSRAGFSLRRDDTFWWRRDIRFVVSIPCWVFSPSRRGGRRALRRRERVSIPCWVFSPSRRRPSATPRSGRACFNPVLGFLSVATGRQRPYAHVAAGFNPVLGFLSVATRIRIRGFWTTDKFQSRAGFSLRRDVAEAMDGDENRRFQSRAGFSLRRDDRPTCPNCDGKRFQSRAGFSLRRDVGGASSHHIYS